MANLELQRQVRQLAHARRAASKVRAELRDRRASFNQENAALIDAIKEAEAVESAAELSVRAIAENEYATTGEKQVTAGVSIAVTKEYAIDEAAGLAWAREKQLCLVPEKLDVAAVKKLATVQPLPFVQVKEKPSVRIATDLESALGAAELAASGTSAAATAETTV